MGIPQCPSHSLTVWDSALSPHPGLLKIYWTSSTEISLMFPSASPACKNLPMGNRAQTDGLDLWTTHFALVNKNWTLKLYFFTYNLPLLYSRICFPVLPGRKISQRICRPFFVEKFYICGHFFLNIFSPQVKISK